MPRFLQSLCTLLLLAPALSMAQSNPPLTESTSAIGKPTTQAANAQQPATTARPRTEQVGDVTRTLLTAQATGVRAGGGLPVLGATADLTWQRYLDSFSHPIPDWFEEKVETDKE